MRHANCWEVGPRAVKNNIIVMHSIDVWAVIFESMLVVYQLVLIDLICYLCYNKFY